MDDAMPTGGTTAAAQPIDGRAAFRAALLVSLDDCAQAGVPEIWLCDPDFVEWPLGRAEIVTALGRWVTPRRRLTLVAGSYDHLAQHCPRWVAWRRQSGHAVRCLQVREEAAADADLVVRSPRRGAAMHRMERVLRGRLYRVADDLAPLAAVVRALGESIDSIRGYLAKRAARGIIAISDQTSHQPGLVRAESSTEPGLPPLAVPSTQPDMVATPEPVSAPSAGPAPDWAATSITIKVEG